MHKHIWTWIHCCMPSHTCRSAGCKVLDVNFILTWNDTKSEINYRRPRCGCFTKPTSLRIFLACYLPFNSWNCSSNYDYSNKFQIVKGEMFPQLSKCRDKVKHKMEATLLVRREFPHQASILPLSKRLHQATHWRLDRRWKVWKVFHQLLV